MNSLLNLIKFKYDETNKNNGKKISDFINITHFLKHT